MTHSARCQSSCYSRGSISVGERRVLSAHPAKMSTDTSIAHREGFPIGWEGYDCPLCITKRLHRHDSHHPDTGTVAGSVSVVCQNLLRQAQHALRSALEQSPVSATKRWRGGLTAVTLVSPRMPGLVESAKIEVHSALQTDLHHTFLRQHLLGCDKRSRVLRPQPFAVRQNPRLPRCCVLIHICAHTAKEHRDGLRAVGHKGVWR